MIEGTTYNSSIPGSIDVNQLEESFNKILTEINVYVASNDIETSHRISTKDTRICINKTNIRFVNRKHAKQAMYNKKKVAQLKKKYTFNANSNPFFTIKNLTRMNESLAYPGRKLKRNNLMIACSTRDCIVTIKINEPSSLKAIKTRHMNDLLEFPPNFDCEDEPFHDASSDISGQSKY